MAISSKPEDEEAMLEDGLSTLEDGLSMSEDTKDPKESLRKSSCPSLITALSLQMVWLSSNLSLPMTTLSKDPRDGESLPEDGEDTPEDKESLEAESQEAESQEAESPRLQMISLNEKPEIETSIMGSRKNW